MVIRYHTSAEQDISDIVEHYEIQRQNLGLEFASAFEKQIHEALKMPTRYQVVRAPVRRLLMKRFPYIVLFCEIPDGIRVLCVKHERRHPKYGLDRS